MILDKPVKAQCTVCGYWGRSKNPERYRCGACYYSAWAAGERRNAARYKKLAAKALAKAKDCEQKAKAFMDNHPDAGVREPTSISVEPALGVASTTTEEEAANPPQGVDNGA